MFFSLSNNPKIFTSEGEDTQKARAFLEKHQKIQQGYPFRKQGKSGKEKAHDAAHQLLAHEMLKKVVELETTSSG